MMATGKDSRSQSGIVYLWFKQADNVEDDFGLEFIAVDYARISAT